MPAAAWHVCLPEKTGNSRLTVKTTRMTQAV
jgi:hypothetical protein